MVAERNPYLPRDVRMVSSIVGEKDTKREMPPKGMTRPPLFKRVSWSLVVSHHTEQTRDCEVRLRISPKEKLSARSARTPMSNSGLGGGCRMSCCNLQAMRINRLLAVLEDCPYSPE